MKQFIYAILGITVAGAVIGFFAGRERKSAPALETVTETAPNLPDQETPASVVSNPGRHPDSLRDDDSRSTSPASQTVKAGVDGPTAFRNALQTLVAPRTTFEQKQTAWHQFEGLTNVDQAIADLEQRATDDPRTPEYQAVLGQMYLRKCGMIQDVREQGILAMNADKCFDAALSLDAYNWDARFTKAVAMSYWPTQMNQGGEVLGHFRTLVQQQEVQPAQPHFALTYLKLGEEYQKYGDEDRAREIWQRGAALYPENKELRARIQTQ